METTKKANGFIDFLDTMKERRSCKYIDYLLILNAIDSNFTDMGLSHGNFIGESVLPPCQLAIRRAEDSNYYKMNSVSLWNTTTNTHNTDNSGSSFYSLWQNEHEAKIIVPNRITKQCSIDVSINKIGDLISIIDENEYSVDTEYNIDLKSLHNIRAELVKMDSMIGMETLKKSVLEQLLYFAQDLHIGNKTSEFKHTVIYGSPGTGKTEIAKIIGEMYSKIGILKNNTFKKVTRSDLIAGYLGQTAIKTRKVIDECMGGVLFIDEAYSLASFDNNDSYSKECLDTLCEALSDHKDDFMVIIAGYKEELDNTFFKANRGLESRFIWRFNMDIYNAVELSKIFKKNVRENNWVFEQEDCLTDKWFSDKKDNFKNCGRDMELLFTFIKIAHSRRIYGKDKDLRKKLTISDINMGYENFLKNTNTKKPENNFMHSIYV
jgi:AAA+ superfamily predicted ATPase